MAENHHPYVTSNGPLIKVINHLKNSFPTTVTADTLKRLGYAPKNESYVINTLRFIGAIDDDGNKTETASKVFTLHDDKDFQKGFSEMVEKAYTGLFALHGDSTWTLDLTSLITFFRQADQSSALVGKRQANTFKAIAGLSGRGELPEPKAKKTTISDKKPIVKQSKHPSSADRPERPQHPSDIPSDQNAISKNRFGLTVRVEINLPAEGNQETYDRIFKSIRENLLNG
ncbi:MAG: DUF5343 domain-containing protein [Sedimentisphaerales bacterium]